jgi:cell wall assembly regulator SMI1
MKPWADVEKWLKAHAPDAFAVLDKPASDKQIKSAEAAMKVTLPAEVRASYRRHNGQGNKGGAVAAPWALLSLKSMLWNWRLQKQLLDGGAFAGAAARAIGPVRADWWNKKWIPIADNGGGDLQCIDLDPGPRGKVGQVIVYLHDDETRECIAPSMTKWLARLAADLKAGRVEPRGLG